MKKSSLSIGLILALVIGASLVVNLVQAAPKTEFTYVESSLMPRDSADVRWKNTNGGITQRRGVGWRGDVNISLLDGEGALVHEIKGTVYYWIKNLVINTKTGHRFSCGIVEIQILTIDDLPSTGSIKGKWVSIPDTQSFREVFTHGTGFFAGTKIAAISNRVWAPGPTLTREAIGTISFPN